MTEVETVLMVIVVIQMLIIAVLVWRNAGMIPPEVVGMLFGFAERKASETPATWDDEAVRDLKAVFDNLNKEIAEKATKTTE